MRLPLALFLLPVLALADSDCPDRPYQLKGGAARQVKDFDEFIAKPRKPAEFAARLAQHGLPFSLDVEKGSVKGVDAWISAEGITGQVAYVFLKKMRVAGKSGLRFDRAVLIEKISDKKAKYEWSVPFNEFYPVALEGDEILFGDTLFPFCRDGDSREVLFALKPDGSLRVRDEKWNPESYHKPLKNCPGKRFFPKSGYATCTELTDRKTKKKMVLVWELPMT